jgi:CRISPR-associated protein Csd1
VLGRLIRLAQYHISKLDKGLAYWYNTRIADILARIPDGLPVTLTLEEQSLFALGYYQQIAADRSRTSTNNTKNEEAKEENVNA